MLWIILSVLCIGFTIFAIYQEINGNWDTLYLITIISTILSVTFICASIDYLIDIKDCKINYERSCYEKQQIELKGKLISEDNTKEISIWVDRAQNFNGRLFKCQSEIKYWGNFWEIRDKRYLEMQPIDIEGYLIKIPTYKIILEK